MAETSGRKVTVERKIVQHAGASAPGRSVTQVTRITIPITMARHR